MPERLIAISLAAAALGCAAQFPSADSLQALKNATYTGFAAPATPVTLKDGAWEDVVARRRITLAGDMRASGDLTGDASAETAVFLAESAGSGERIYLAIVSTTGGQVKNIATTFVGPNVRLRKMGIANRRVVIDAIQVGPNDAMCCPSEVVTRAYTLDGGTLKEQPVVTTSKLTPDIMAGTEWTLRALGTSDPAPAAPKVTLRFEGGRFVGNSGCNRYTAAVTAGDRPGAIAVSPGVSTRMACAPPAMDLEGRFLRQLQAVTGYTFVAGQLALEYKVDATYGAMRFDAAP